ncbi:MAG: hypothetical protein IKA23_01860 [Akkermansia sp.]|nr:hypothetical protein [Akkermansia sp.]
MNFLYIYDCVTGRAFQATQAAQSIGNRPDAGIRLSMKEGIAALVMTKGESYVYYPKLEYTRDSETTKASFEIENGRGYLIGTNGGLFHLYCTPTPPEMQQKAHSKYDNKSWYYYHAGMTSWQGPFSPAQLLNLSRGLPESTVVTMQGLPGGTCSLQAFCSVPWQEMALQKPVPAVPPPAPAAPTAPAAPAVSAAPPAAMVPPPLTPAAPSAPVPAVDPTPVTQEMEFEQDDMQGTHLCPSCWLRFNAGDVMSIASHPSLMGDPILGPDAMKRFHARRFNLKGQAVDEKGMPCPHLACPHCRHKLPPRFLEIETLIFSIIGAPASGKSYYLASLIHEMTYVGGKGFNLAWRDADPAGNAQLNEVSTRLFSSATPQQAYLTKTDLEGALYEEFYRRGRMVKLPKPFVYNLSVPQSKLPPVSVVFYDNAGEHFEPGRSSEDSPGAMHVPVASGIIFLFDPTTSKAFRRIITQTNDPQLKTEAQRIDQQAIIMAETESRIVEMLNHRAGELLDTPFAVLIGKCDLWESYLSTPEGGGAGLLPVCEDGKVIRANIEANSKRLRSLMMSLEPSICTTAESISSCVRYFAVSQLGAPPITFEDAESGVTRIGPDPSRIAPRYMCDPTLWLLSELMPGYVQSV